MKTKELAQYVRTSLEDKVFLDNDYISEDEFEKFIIYLSYDVTDWIKGNYNAFCLDTNKYKEKSK